MSVGLVETQIFSLQSVSKVVSFHPILCEVHSEVTCVLKPGLLLKLVLNTNQS